MAATELVSAAPAPGKARQGRWPAFARLSRTLMARLSVLALPAAVIVILGATASLLAAPAIVVADQWLDVFLALDAGLHWAHEHRPHEDFHTPLGAAYVALMGLAGTLADFGPRALLWANAAVAASAALALALTASRRLNGPLAALTTLYWTLLALSPRRLAGGVEDISWTAAYNKWGFALLAALWLAAAVPAQRGGRRLALAEAVLLGAALCFLFYLKLTFFAAGAAPFLFRALTAGRSHERRAALLPVLFGAALIGLAAPGVSLPGYAQDLLMTAAASHGFSAGHLSLDLGVNILLVAAAVAAYWAHYRAFRTAERPLRARASRRRGLFLLLFILAFAVNNQNTSTAIPLLALLPLILAVEPAGGAGRLPRAARLAMLLAPACYFLWWGGVDLRAIAGHNAAAAAGDGMTFCLRTDAPLCAMRIVDTDPQNPAYGLTFAETRPVNEELFAALDPLVTPDSRIVHFGFASLLNARYGLEPPRGGLLFWHYGRNYSDGARPEAEAVFAEATLVVMARSKVSSALDENQRRLYGAYVRRHFRLAVRTPHWDIYQRRAETR